VSADESALLVVIDMQRVFADPDSPWSIPDFVTLETPISRLLTAFGERAVFTRFMVPADPAGSWRRYFHEWSFALEPGAEKLFELAAPWSDYGRRPIDKPTFSAYGAELQAAFAGRLGVTTLVLCGVSTECCVLATALAAADDGIAVRIVRDACASVDRATHEAALHVALTGFAPLIGLTTVEQELEWVAGDGAPAYVNETG
jgi:nicotinamidase-related amidase